MTACFRLVIAASAILTLPTPVLFAADEPVFKTDEAGFKRVVEPFLQQHCVRCHGAKVNEGEFRVDTQLDTDFLDRTTQGKWGEVINVLSSNEMPPEDEQQPADNSVAAVVDWITKQMAQAELHRRDSAIVLRRINRA